MFVRSMVSEVLPDLMVVFGPFGLSKLRWQVTQGGLVNSFAMNLSF